MVCSKIRRKLKNFGLGPRSMVLVRHIIYWLIFIIKGGSKKEKFHLNATAMAGHKVVRYNLGSVEANAGKYEQALKHWTIAAAAGREEMAMQNIYSISLKMDMLVDIQSNHL